MTARTITVDELRGRLERGERLVVLDVRRAGDRAEWAIPGSQHADVHDALWAGDGRGLASLPLSADVPVVAVCNRGRTSLLAVDVLERRGIKAVSLEGGMKAWSLAWNMAEAPVPGSGATVLQVRRTGKGCLSYLIAAGSQAAVIDASVEPQVYLDLAHERGWTIGAVVETHVHADHLSRARALADRIGAKLYLPDQRRVRFPFAPIKDGDAIGIGPARLQALHTPGHTFESTCYLLDGRALFTGDTLFLSAVGRPDLKAKEESETRERARALHASLQRLLGLDPGTVVFPCHTSEPIAFDGRPLGAPLRVVRQQTELLGADADTFVRMVLGRIPPTPPNHLQIVALNEAGTAPPADPTDLEAGANRCAVP